MATRLTFASRAGAKSVRAAPVRATSSRGARLVVMVRFRRLSRPSIASPQQQRSEIRRAIEARGRRAGARADPVLPNAQAKRNEVSDSYAKALVDLADEKSKLEPVHADVDAVANLLKENAKLREMLMNPLIEGDKKKAVIARIGKEAGFQQYTMNFLNLLVAKDRVGLLDEICESFEEQYCVKTDTQVRGRGSLVLPGAGVRGSQCVVWGMRHPSARRARPCAYLPPSKVFVFALRAGRDRPLGRQAGLGPAVYDRQEGPGADGVEEHQAAPRHRQGPDCRLRRRVRLAPDRHVD